MKFRQARRLLDLSQKQIEEKTGIYQVKISRIERGKVNPTIFERRKLEQALNLPGGINWEFSNE